jgi:hypothetical protein
MIPALGEEKMPEDKKNDDKQTSRRDAIKRIGVISCCAALTPRRIVEADPGPVKLACYNSCLYASQSEYYYLEGNPMPIYQSISYTSCYNSCECYNSCLYASQSEYYYLEGNPMPIYQSISYNSCYNSCG